MYTTVSRSFRSCKLICIRQRQLTTLPAFHNIFQNLPILAACSARILHSARTSIPVQLHVPAMKFSIVSGKHGLLHTITNADYVPAHALRYRECSDALVTELQPAPQKSESHVLLEGSICQWFSLFLTCPPTG